MHGLEERVARLEGQVRLLRVLAAGGVGLALALGAALVLAGPRRVEARGLDLVDAQGRVLGTFGVDEAGVALRIRDERGIERVRLGMVRDLPSLLLFDEGGAQRVVLESAPPGPGLALFGPDGRASAIFADEEGTPLLSAPTGRTLWSPPASVEAPP